MKKGKKINSGCINKTISFLFLCQRVCLARRTNGASGIIDCDKQTSPAVEFSGMPSEMLLYSGSHDRLCIAYLNPELSNLNLIFKRRWCSGMFLSFGKVSLLQQIEINYSSGHNKLKDTFRSCSEQRGRKFSCPPSALNNGFKVRQVIQATW